MRPAAWADVEFRLTEYDAPVSHHGTTERPTRLGRCLPRLIDLTPVLDEVDSESPFDPVDSVEGSIAANPQLEQALPLAS